VKNSKDLLEREGHEFYSCLAVLRIDAGFQPLRCLRNGADLTDA
jgi:hypothetical protein